MWASSRKVASDEDVLSHPKQAFLDGSGRWHQGAPPNKASLVEPTSGLVNQLPEALRISYGTCSARTLSNEKIPNKVARMRATH